MIKREISSKILLISPRGRGGIAALTSSYSEFYESFNVVYSSDNTATKGQQVVILICAILKSIYYFIFKRVRIVHIHSSSGISFFRKSIFVILSKLFRKKVVLHQHSGRFESFYKNNETYCRWICNKADVLVAVSSFIEKILRKHKLNRDIVVIYNIFSASAPNHNIRALKEGELMELLFMGSVDDNKGIFEIIDMLIDKREYLLGKVHLSICGEGEVERLLHLINVNKINELVTFHGWVNGSQKSNLMAISDVYIQPSHFESFGISILEAMSYGLPIISTRTGGIPELVFDGVNGYLVEVGDMKNLFERILELYNNRELREQLGKKGEKLSLNFSQMKIEVDIEELYGKLL